MKITREADYAVRVTYVLMCESGKANARFIAETSGITLRFALKILHKLTAQGLIRSYKGVNGGFELARAPEDISIGEVIECIDGPFDITHCIPEDFECTRVSDKKTCPFRKLYVEAGNKIRDDLYSIKFSEFADKN